MPKTVATSKGQDAALRESLMVTPSALAALERQAERQEMTLAQLVGCILEQAGSQLLIEESVVSIELGKPCDQDYLAIENGFDVGGGDA
ncbi:MAG TPA: hypothetical protein VFZ96_00340 [Actinomycetota bacterium]|jgi:hypothetical protein|nr:hypothetical protein [Actinomycetota bacterium]